MKSRIIGIDPGLNNMGWGIIEIISEKLVYIASGVIKTKNNINISSRFAILFQALNNIILEFQPTLSAIEVTYVNMNSDSSLKLAQARAIAMLSLELNNLTPASYPAKQIKKAVTGYGSSDKKQVIKMINILFPNAMIENADIADAIAIAVCHSSYNNIKLKI